MSMGRFFDFAKRRIVGYIVFWILVLLFLGVFYQGNAPAQAGGLFILGWAFIGPLLYTRRMKPRQRPRGEAEQRVQRVEQAYRTQPVGAMPSAPPARAPPAQGLT